MKCQRPAILQQFEKPETDSFDLVSCLANPATQSGQALK